MFLKINGDMTQKSNLLLSSRNWWMTCLWCMLTKCSQTSQGQPNDWENPPWYTVITQLAFTWEIGLRRVTTALLRGGNLNVSCWLQKKQNSWKHSSLCVLKILSNQGEFTPNLRERQFSHREHLLPPIILGGFGMLGSEILLGIESTPVCTWVWANAHPASKPIKLNSHTGECCRWALEHSWR